MATLKERFHLYKKKETFNTNLKAGLISPDSICFIEETREIYTQNNYYSIPKKVEDLLFKDSNNGEQSIDKIETLYDVLRALNDPDECSILNMFVDDFIKELIGKSGYIAPLDNAGLVPSEHLPSYVDDVLEYNTRNDFPTTGEKGKIYVDTATNSVYRWGGSTYIKIVNPQDIIKLGQTSGTAYPGDLGAANARDIKNKVDKVVGKGLSTNDFTDADKAKLNSSVSTNDLSTLAQRVTNIEEQLAWKIL